MEEKPASSIDEYLVGVPEEQRVGLEKLRKQIKAAAPEATETISYRMPAFYDHGPLVSFAAFKDHLSFFVMSMRVMDAHRGELEAFDVSKGTIRFQPGKPLPAALVKKLVKARIKENVEGKSPRKTAARRARHPMPDYIERELEGKGLMDAYKRRPPYQQNDYVGWITRAKQEATRQKRLDRMLGELESGDVYMKMAWVPGNKRVL
jgi:uncharacterized protein YdhG (YjbR/CyaY superfamily)